MARSIYRLYLYIVAIGALANAAFWVGHLLYELFLPAPQRECIYPCPPAEALVSAWWAAALACLALGSLGGLHYRWIWMDIDEDAEAGTGFVRALALNLAQGIFAVGGLFAGVYAFWHLEQWSSLRQPATPALNASQHALLAVSLAVALVAPFAWAGLQYERCRTREPAPGAPLTTQRVHLYLVQALVLVAGFVTFRAAIRDLVGPTHPDAVKILGDWLSALVVAGIGSIYAFLVRGDTQSILRLLTQLLGFTIGLAATVLGVSGITAGILCAIWRVSLPSGFPGDAVSYLVLGVAFTVGFGAWLLREADHNRMGRTAAQSRTLTELTMLALAALVIGVAFYAALILLGTNALTSPPVDAQDWASSFGLLLAGLAHPPLALWLRRRSAQLAPTIPRLPRQAFMLASLAAGLLTVAAAFVLLEVNFGSIFLDPSWWPRIQNDLLTLWQHATMLCSGVCATTPGVRPPTIVVIVAVGLFIAMWHGSLALREGWLPHMSAPTKSSTKAQQAAATADDADPVATTLDDLAAGRITRDEALERLRTPPRQGKSAR